MKHCGYFGCGGDGGGAGDGGGDVGGWVLFLVVPRCSCWLYQLMNLNFDFCCYCENFCHDYQCQCRNHASLSGYHGGGDGDAGRCCCCVQMNVRWCGDVQSCGGGGDCDGGYHAGVAAVWNPCLLKTLTSSEGGI